MHCGEDEQPPYIASHQNGPYSSSLASSASSSSASVWSDTASQSSDDSSLGGISQEAAKATVVFSSTTSAWQKNTLPIIEAPAELRQHPRRTSAGSATRSGCPPTLVRQSDRKVSFVDSLVDSSAQIVETIWPLSSIVCRTEMGSKGVLPLRTFIQETLRRSRTSYSTLQVALYYLILIKPHVPKHDFTMEQSDESHSARALQCGRRMFLSALILASKYLQDRNYSARAWSKISGLNTMEINQNEIAFLLAVNWRLHITDAVFQRWTEIVLKYTPNQPPSSGSSALPVCEQQAEWKAIVSRLEPNLENIDDIIAPSIAQLAVMPTRPVPPTHLSTTGDRTYGSHESTPTPNYYSTPSTMEPALTAAYSSSRQVPALGLLPTPRLTPQTTSFNTPAVSAASYMLNKTSSMSFAMAQASTIGASQLSEKWQPQYTSSPHSYVTQRRSSLANSVSTASSPESMVSDTSSRSSRSSSISSASSMASAPISSKLDVQARCRSAKLYNDRNRQVITTVPENFYSMALSSSPESYTGPGGKDFLDLSLDTPLARQEVELDCTLKDEEAARALQDLQNSVGSTDNINRTGAKRSRPESTDYSLQENVRELLTGSAELSANWSDSLVRPRYHNLPVSPTSAYDAQATSKIENDRKRVRYAAEAVRNINHTQPAHNNFGPGMWDGIL